MALFIKKVIAFAFSNDFAASYFSGGSLPFFYPMSWRLLRGRIVTIHPQLIHCDYIVEPIFIFSQLIPPNFTNPYTIFLHFFSSKIVELIWRIHARSLIHVQNRLYTKLFYRYCCIHWNDHCNGVCIHFNGRSQGYARSVFQYSTFVFLECFVPVIYRRTRHNKGVVHYTKSVKCLITSIFFTNTKI